MTKLELKEMRIRVSAEVKELLESEAKILGIPTSNLCAYYLGQHAKEIKAERYAVEKMLGKGYELLEEIKDEKEV